MTEFGELVNKFIDWKSISYTSNQKFETFSQCNIKDILLELFESRSFVIKEVDTLEKLLTYGELRLNYKELTYTFKEDFRFRLYGEIIAGLKEDVLASYFQHRDLDCQRKYGPIKISVFDEVYARHWNIHRSDDGLMCDGETIQHIHVYINEGVFLSSKELDIIRDYVRSKNVTLETWEDSYDFSTHNWRFNPSFSDELAHLLGKSFVGNRLDKTVTPVNFPTSWGLPQFTIKGMRNLYLFLLYPDFF